MEMLDSKGFRYRYNFVYLPMDLCTKTLIGHALVNFVCHEVARDALGCLDGLCAWKVRSSVVCSASWSKYNQGLDALIERYRNSPIMHDRVPAIYKPLVLEAGGPVPFPTPTRT